MSTQWEATFFDVLQRIYDQFGWLGISMLMVLESATGFTSSELLLSLAGWLLIETHGMPPSMILIGGLYAGLGNAIGASLSYWIARLGGRPLVEKLFRWSQIKMDYLDWAETYVRRWGIRLVLFGRLVPGVRILVSVPAGLARMPFAAFFAATFTGAYIWCTSLIGVGYWLGHEWMFASLYIKAYFPYIMGAGLAILALSLLYLFRTKFSRSQNYQGSPKTGVRASLGACAPVFGYSFNFRDLLNLAKFAWARMRPKK